MNRANWALVARGEEHRRRNGAAGVHPAAVFRALLAHERARADRDGSEFSLVALDGFGPGGNGRDTRLVARTVRGQMRSIDEVGWLDARSIGVLLPATGWEGGRRFACRLLEALHGPSSRISWEVYTYPGRWAHGNGDSQHADTRPSAATVERAFCSRIPLWKRCIDVPGAVILLVALSPLFAIMAAYIRLVSPGKVIFRQRRVGYGGKEFTFIKFRTMHENNNHDEHREYLKELINGGKPMEKLDQGRDRRIIPGGRFVRKACLDELPQLVNVLRGEMSLVGPRPCIPYEAEEYLRWHKHRFDILPGLTGLWQVSGKNKLTFEQMVRLDITYAQKMSPFLDLKILFLTLPAIIRMVCEAGAKRLGIKAAPASPGCSETAVSRRLASDA